jgi:two-component system secretion response regulator SsrB
MTHIRVAVVDDHDVVRIGLKAVLDATPDLNLVGEFESGSELRAWLEHNPVDIVLLDIHMPGFKLDMIDQVRLAQPPAKIIVVTGETQPDWVRAVARHKVEGYVLKEEVGVYLVQAIHEVARGRHWFSPSVSYDLAHDEDGPIKLTEQEQAVLALTAQGLTPAEIAQKHDKSQAAIYQTLTRLRVKLGVDTTQRLLLEARRLGLLS